VTKELVSKVCSMASTAPLMTAVSKPKRKPPMAATIARKRTRPECPRSTVDPVAITAPPVRITRWK
jgi:hypothetical protein